MDDENNQLKQETIENVEISKQIQKLFLDYSMSVIISRAIPDVCDGLKPVQRRIIYSMYTSGLTYDKPYKKSARVVGDVMGRFHPHGDSAIYSSLVRLAQKFSMRYTLVDGHGNFGSIDGDEAAAHRYTEARLSKISLQLVRDIDCNVVKTMDNYDGAEQEPVVLPSRFPNLLVNGSSGIAVGMATNIPPHNLSETINAVIALAKNSNLSIDEIMQFLPGPDFPTGGIILGRSGIKKAYETGSGSIVVRAKHHFENLNKKTLIVIDEIPYGVNKAELVKNISFLAKETIDGITHISDESNMKGIRIVISVRSDCIPEVILNKLFALTKLQNNFNVIFLCLEHNVPKVMSVKDILSSYLEHQINVINKRTVFLQKKDLERKNIIQGFLIAINNIKEIVDIIKESNTTEEVAEKMLKKYDDLNEIQVQAILGMALRRLTGLEKNKLTAEEQEIEKRLLNYEHILKSRENALEVIVKELEEIKQQFGDERRTVISDEEGLIDEESLIPKKDIIVAITTNGYIKRMDVEIFRKQNVGGVGSKGMTINDDDIIKSFVFASTHSNLLFFSNKGKVYRFKGYKLPVGNKNAKGIPAQNFFNFDKTEKIVSIIVENDIGNLTFVTKRGLIKQTCFSEYKNINKGGKIAIKLNENDNLLGVESTSDNCLMCLASKKGKMAVFENSQVRKTARNTKGVKGINVGDGEVIGFCTSLSGKNILSITENGFGKMTDIKKYRVTKRSAKGTITMKITKKNGFLVTIMAVNGNEDLIAVTNKGMTIRISLSKLRFMNRNTQGKRIINLKQGQKISSVAVIPLSNDKKEEINEFNSEEQNKEE